MMSFEGLTRKALEGSPLSEQECLDVLSCPDSELPSLISAAFALRRKYFGMRVGVQLLTNARGGGCTEDCGYCAQSSVAGTSITPHPLLAVEQLLDGARRAKSINATRYCMGLSGIRYGDALIDALAGAIRIIKEDTGMPLCCSIGLLTPSQAAQLKAAGLDRINHNLNACRSFYPRICSTHTHDERIRNLAICRDAGLEICCGGIIGLGEGPDGVIALLTELRAINPDALPLNFFVPIPGTPLADRGEELTPTYCLKALCLARFMHPTVDLRAAGGREYHLRSLQALALYPANAIFVSGYLTTDGQPAGEGIQMIRDLGFTVECEGEA